MQRCVSCASLSILMNGSLGPKFNMNRGLKHQCPLSLLLFNLVAKSPPLFLNQFQSRGWFHGIAIQGMDERINVLQFANDTIFSLKNSEKLSSRYQICLTIFSFISGLNINLSKSIIIKVDEDQNPAIQATNDLGCRVGFFAISYLGLLLGGRIFDYSG